MKFWRIICGTAAWFVVLTAPTAVADERPQQAADEPAQNPIGTFLQRLLNVPRQRPAAPRAADDEGLPKISPATRIVPDAIDERAASGREQVRAFDRARRLLNEAEADIDTPAGAAVKRRAALGRLQSLLDDAEDTLSQGADGAWESLQRRVERSIGERHPQTRQAYVDQYGTQANDALRLARRTGDPRHLAMVTRRYLNTPAGREAARSLAGLARDTGEPIEFAYWTMRAGGRLAVDPSPATKEGSRGTRSRFNSRPSTNWAQPFGGPTHTGRTTSVDPVLIERWAASTVVRPAVAEQIEQLTRDLTDAGRACVSTAVPLAIDGKIITRTLRGLSALDADTGRVLWETPEGVSVERLLSGDVLPRPGRDSGSRRSRMVQPYRGSSADAHPLTGLLYQDGVYGLLSSDGSRVFVLEDHASLSYRQPGYAWGQRANEDPYDRDWGTNRLVAYDIDTGRPLWSIGGEQRNELFDPPLAGTYFLGPPVVDREELFVIGERLGSISLYVLNARTGDVNWSQLLSGVGTKIEQDLIRRWWPAQAAIGAGVIVCPTTAGWLVAVDRLEHRIRWAYRYIETRQKKVSTNRSRVMPASPLNARWAPSAPVIVGGYVVFTPPELPDPLHGERPITVGIDLLTGQRAWRRNKESALYLGGVADGRVLLVGSDGVEALDLETGRLEWQTDFDVRVEGIDTRAEGVDDRTPSKTTGVFGKAGRPTGRGIIAGNELLIPLHSGQLWGVDVTTGRVTRTLKLRDGERPLGTLVVDHGRLLSLDPLELRSFESRHSLETARQQPAENTVAARLRSAELQFLDGHFEKAHQTLRTLLDAAARDAAARKDAALSEQQRAAVDRLRWDTLSRLVQDDFTGRDAEFAELQTLTTSAARRLAVERIQADRLLARGEREAAFDLFWKSAESHRPARTPIDTTVDDSLVNDALVDEGLTSVRFDRWLSGRLRSLWESADGPTRAAYDRRMAEHVDVLLTTEARLTADASPSADVFRKVELAELRWWGEVLRFHPVSIRLRRALAGRALDDEQWTAAEIFLRQIINESSQSEERARAWRRLIQLTLDRQRPHDAAVYASRIDPVDLKVPLDDGVLLGDWLSSLRESQTLPTDGYRQSPQWSGGGWSLKRIAASFDRKMATPVLARAIELPDERAMTFRVQSYFHRLTFLAPGGEPVWQTPLSSQTESFYNHTTGVSSVGSLTFVVHQGILHAMSPWDRELLWSRPFDLRSASAGFVRGPSISAYDELRDVRGTVYARSLRQMHTPLGMLSVWRPGYVAYFGRQSLTVADPLTGETLWTRRQLAPRTMVYGTHDRLIIVPPSPGQPVVLDVIDGTEIDVPRLRRLLPSAIAFNEGGLLVLQEEQPFSLFGWNNSLATLKLVEPATNKTVWRTSFAKGTRFTMLDDAELVAVTPEGEVSLVDSRSGESRVIAALGADVMHNLQRLFAFTDRGRLYLAFNKPPAPGTYTRSYQAATINGLLVAFDRRRGELLWQETVAEQNLVVDQLEHLPVLLFTAQRPQRKNNVTTHQIAVQVRDKQTGQLLLDDARYITGGSIRELVVNQDAQFIDLHTYNERLRLKVASEE